ncbi:DcmR-like sensory protein [Roseiarcus fermentans]|uniref:DcmR-like sensory protein n=1 Tax=Roseiarcus fermentans TaxID=1473586 RepID=A0A366EII2_9HYPH|nr:MEDS domain-containing protein [Roseiarcus fermentans]RBP02222.1 DcmR-like sensory protein [Roseiarcus fermentans]
MDKGFHAVVLYETSDELWNRLRLPLEAAERAGAVWRYFTDRRPIEGINGVCEQATDARVIDSASVAMYETPISVKTIITLILKLAEDAKAEGNSGLLAVIDMSWMLNTPSGIAHQGEFETAIEAATRRPPLSVICVYNLRLFPDSMILDALQTHRFIFTSAGLCRNPHFLRPDAFLSGDPAEKLGCWLENLGPKMAVNWWSPPAVSISDLKRSGHNASTTLLTTPGEHARRRASGGDQLAPYDFAPAPRHRWKIRCFGNLRIFREDGSQVRWNTVNGATAKTKTLFAYLLQRGRRGACFEEIADLLWPEAEHAGQSLNRLYHTVHCLRIALSPELTTSRASPYVLAQDHRYFLNLPDGAWIDVPVFEEFARRGDILLLQGNLEDSMAIHSAAEKIYTGSLFSDIPAQYVQSVDHDWCWSRRYWLEGIYVKMLTNMATLHRQRGNVERSLSYALRALDIDPCFEHAHREIMRGFHGSGRHDALKRQYQLCCGALKRYEDRTPSPDTRSLFQQLAS